MAARTQIAEKLQSAGVDTSASRLYAAAQEYLQGHRNPHIAFQSFVEAVQRDPELQAALARKYIQDIALRYLDEVARDMTGRTKSEAQPRAGRSKYELDSNLMHDPAGSPRNGGGKFEDGSKNQSDAAGTTDETSNEYGDSNSCSEPSRPSSAPRRGIDAYRAHSEVVARSLFDTWKVDGKPIGDLSWRDLTRIAHDRLSEGHALTWLLKRAAHVPDPAMRVREIVSEDDLKRAKQKGAEMSDVV